MNLQPSSLSRAAFQEIFFFLSKNVRLNQSEFQLQLITSSVCKAFGGAFGGKQFEAKFVNTVVERWGKLDILYFGAGGFFVPTKEFADDISTLMSIITPDFNGITLI